MDEIRSIPGSIQSTPIHSTDSNESTNEIASVDRVNDASDTVEGVSEQNTFTAALVNGSKIEETSDASGEGIQELNDLKISFDTEMNHAINGLKQFEEKLNSLGDDAQLLNIDLQNILQKQQQTLQMMSNISKMLFDNAMAVIRKIGG